MLGTPVVASRVGGIPEIVRHEDTGLLVPEREPEALASGILRVIGEPGLGGRLNEAGRALVMKSFSVDAMVEGTLAVYRKVLSRGLAPD